MASSDHVMIQGFLFMRAGKGKAWMQKYFVLSRNGPTLMHGILHSDQSFEPTAEIVLTQDTNIAPLEKQNCRFPFEIRRGATRLLLIDVESSADRSNWIRLLHNCVSGLDGRPKSTRTNTASSVPSLSARQQQQSPQPPSSPSRTGSLPTPPLTTNSIPPTTTPIPTSARQTPASARLPPPPLTSPPPLTLTLQTPHNNSNHSGTQSNNNYNSNYNNNNTQVVSSPHLSQALQQTTEALRSAAEAVVRMSVVSGYGSVGPEEQQHVTALVDQVMSRDPQARAAALKLCWSLFDNINNTRLKDTPERDSLRLSHVTEELRRVTDELHHAQNAAADADARAVAMQHELENLREVFKRSGLDRVARGGELSNRSVSGDAAVLKAELANANTRLHEAKSLLQHAQEVTATLSSQIFRDALAPRIPLPPLKNIENLQRALVLKEKECVLLLGENSRLQQVVDDLSTNLLEARSGMAKNILSVVDALEGRVASIGLTDDLVELLKDAATEIDRQRTESFFFREYYQDANRRAREASNKLAAVRTCLANAQRWVSALQMQAEGVFGNIPQSISQALQDMIMIVRDVSNHVVNEDKRFKLENAAMQLQSIIHLLQPMSNASDGSKMMIQGPSENSGDNSPHVMVLQDDLRRAQITIETLSREKSILNETLLSYQLTSPLPHSMKISSSDSTVGNGENRTLRELRAVSDSLLEATREAERYKAKVDEMERELASLEQQLATSVHHKAKHTHKRGSDDSHDDSRMFESPSNEESDRRLSELQAQIQQLTHDLTRAQNQSRDQAQTYAPPIWIQSCS
eukprot:c13338_g1_i1.p1 GENE.c13338_g1_i1~~c13338_g1_i1.p1  ORF type:complete len:806 (-),score=226.55 c13338_g1_i1:227-2644(-)